MKRHGFTRVEVVSILAVIGLLVAVLLPASAQWSIFTRPRENNRRSACQSNLKLLAVGVRQYLQDYDELHPLVTGGTAVSDYGWAVAIQPYIRNLQLFQCPSEKHEAGIDPIQPNYTDYWYNRNLSRASEASIEYMSNTLLFGDGDGGYKASNARYAINKLPSGWIETPGSPALRHLDGASYAFTDGHVKWMKPRYGTTAKPSGTVVTFRVQ